MADIFISYKREDKEKAAMLADKLMASGWSVWWDHDLLGGEDYDVVIERELAEAKAVIVIWSVLSKQSRPVKDEANKALKRNVLVPVTFDNTEPPIGFGMTHTIIFENKNQITDTEYKKLYNSIKNKTAIGDDEVDVTIPPVRVTKKNKTALFVFLGIAVVAVIIFLMFNRPKNSDYTSATKEPVNAATEAVDNTANKNGGISRHVRTEEEEVAAIFGNKALEETLPGDTITHYTIKQVTDKSITITVEYSYNLRHNNGVYLGAWLYKSADAGGYPPVILSSPAGNADITISLSDIKTAFTSEGILVFMGESYKSPFTYKVFNYQHTWNP
jgi:hypothetical protein